MTNLKKSLTIVLLSVASLSASAQLPVEVSGTLIKKFLSPIKLFKVAEGKAVEIAHTTPSKGGKFGLMFYPEYEGLYVLGTGVAGGPNDNYKFYFKDYESGQPIKSLVDSSKKTQYAVGTGTTFDVIYGSNINLDPTIKDEVAANFQNKDKSIRLSYYKNSNPVYGDFIYDNSQNILTFSQKNFDKESGFMIDFTIPFTYKFWTVNNSLSFILNKIEDKLAIQNTTKPYLYYYTNHVFKLPKDYTVSTTVWGLTTQYEGVYERRQPEFIMDLAISKTFFKKWDCTFGFNDVFKNFVYKENFTINKISSKSNYLSDTHEISFGIRYSFGKMKNSEFNEKNINDDENRIR